MDYRIGIGQDSHKFGGENPLVLGGVEIPDYPGLKSNSDGDIVLHALFNAISSALGQGSIGKYADPVCFEQGEICSREYLKTAIGLLDDSNYKINNVSISIEAKMPKIDPHVKEMKGVISELLRIDSERIGITATTGEELSAFGRGEGIMVIVAVTLKNED